MQYDSHTSFNENNITLYLAELEEYFSTLITYTSSQRGDANPAISSVPLETLNDKEFNKKEVPLEAPSDVTEKTDADTEDAGDYVIDPRQLY